MFSKKFQKSKVFYFFVIMLWSGFALGSDYYIVANSDVPGTKIAKEKLKSIFLGNEKFWNGEIRIKIARTTGDSDFEEKYIQDITEKSKKKFTRYWRKKLYSGFGSPPKQFSSDQDTLEFVKKESGAIAIVTKKVSASGFKYLELEN